jgi:ABC-type sugar transport system permease subunit
MAGSATFNRSSGICNLPARNLYPVRSEIMASTQTGLPATGMVTQQSRGVVYQVRKTLRRPQFWFGLMVLLPTIAWYLLFQFGPIARGLVMAFTNQNFLEPEKTKFIGLLNFRMVTEHFLFPIATGKTLLYAFELWIICFPLALLTSVSLVSIKKGRNFFQFTIFIPVVVSLVAMTLLFKQILDPDTGIVNAGLRALHLPEGKFLTDESSALTTVAAIDAWKILGTYMVLLTAGLLNIPQEFYDAAYVDGANSWQVFWRITMPLLSPILMLVITMLLIQGLQVYVSAALLPKNSGGPGYATTVLSIWLYSEAFGNWRFGFASAIAIWLFIIVFLIQTATSRLRATFEY